MVFYEARDLEAFRPYFGYVRVLYPIGLAPWYQLTRFGRVYAEQSWGYTPSREGVYAEWLPVLIPGQSTRVEYFSASFSSIPNYISTKAFMTRISVPKSLF